MSRKKVQTNIAYDDARKTYYVNMDYGKDANTGKRIKKVKSYKTLPEARKALKEYEADKTKGQLIAPNRITLGEWMTHWITNIKPLKCDETTLYGYRNIINKHIIPLIGHVFLQEVKPSTIYTYFGLAKNNHGLNDNTLRKHYVLLKDSFKYAMNDDKILKNPLDRVDAPKKQKREMCYYSAEELELLIQAAGKDRRMRVIIMLGALYGLRRGEIAGLRWKDIKFKEDSTLTVNQVRTQAGGKIVIKDAKTLASHRTLHLTKNMGLELISLRELQRKRKNALGDSYVDTEYVITADDGRLYKPNHLNWMLEQVIIKNNLKPITLHGLRHTFASLSNAAGVGIHDTSKALGHASIAITSGTYTHLFDNKHESTLQQIDAFVDSRINKYN